MQLNKTNTGAQGAAARMAGAGDLLWKKGWAEGSGGNISVNVTEFYPGIFMDFRTFPLIRLEKKYASLAHNYIFITAKGSRLRDMLDNKGEAICLIKIDKTGSAYQVLFEDPENPHLPSSELPSHLAIHALLNEKAEGEKAIVHAHVNELISLSHHPELKSEEALNRILLRMHTETAYFLPTGIGFIPFEVPGSLAIAKKTLSALENHKVILLEKHGCIAIGKDVHEAFDRIDMLAKAAGIYLNCRMAGIDPEGLTDKQLKKIKGTSIP